MKAAKDARKSIMTGIIGNVSSLLSMVGGLLSFFVFSKSSLIWLHFKYFPLPPRLAHQPLTVLPHSLEWMFPVSGLSSVICLKG